MLKAGIPGLFLPMRRTILLILMLLLSLLAILYPLISNFVNEKFRSEIRTEYYETIEEMDDGALETERHLAYEYNALLAGGVLEAYSDEGLTNASAEYTALLNLNGDSVMGYVEIPKLGIHLPIRHGTDAQTLESGVGHVIGSSLPVGGENTHAVLSAHSGMAREKMFSDLDQLSTGDIFFLHVLGETLAYEVDAINTVLPADVSLLAIETDKDLVTLVTCTPFGVNTHRLLVREYRVPFTEVSAEHVIAAAEPIESTWEQEYKKGLLWGLCALLALFIGYLLIQKLTPKKSVTILDSPQEGILLETILISLYGLRFEEDV